MPPPDFRAVDLLIAIAPPGALVAVLLVLLLRPRQLWVALAVGAAVTLASWAAISWQMTSVTTAFNRRYEELAARGEWPAGEPVPPDYVGDNAMALLCGWLPAGAGTAVGIGGFVLARGMRRRVRRHD